VVDLHHHRLENEEIAAELRHESCGESECRITPVRGRDEWPAIGDRFQRSVTGSRR
jgi:hypothetical protein